MAAERAAAEKAAAAKAAAEKVAAEKAAAEKAAKKAAEVKAAAEKAAMATRRQLMLEQLQAAAAPPLSRLDPGALRFALEQARQNGVGGSEVEAAELTLRAATELEPSLVAMLEQLGIAPAPLVQANLRSVVAVAAGAGALRAALGAAEAAALLDAAQRVAVTPSSLEVAAARLVVGERLGAGSFGTVHAARLDGGEQLALKRVSLAGLPPAQRDETLRAAAREVGTLSHLVHPHVVRLHGVVVDEAESIGMLIELARRGSLRDVLDRTPAEVVGREAVQMELARGIAAAMAFLHARAPAVLHHDLKSANVLVFDTGVGSGSASALLAKLTDFGLSLTASGSTLASTMRAGGGTVAYQAPEQFDGTFTAASEVYSFAIILWELLHGGRPWDGKTPAAIMRTVDRGQRPEVAAAGSGLHEVMCECWAAEPSDRPTFEGAEARLTTALRTFETSTFKQRYAATSEVTMQHTLWAALHGLVLQEARRLGVPQARAEAALLWVQRSAFTAGDNSGLQERQIGS